MWERSSIGHLERLAAQATQSLFVCSPYYSSTALAVIQNSLPASISSVEIWTRMDLRDWLNGVCDPEGLLDFLSNLPNSATPQLFVENSLHAKMYVANDRYALAGSANLTSGGFARNIEILQSMDAPTVKEIIDLREDMRPLLTPISLDQWTVFVTQCQQLAQEREALLDLTREAAEPGPGARPLISLQRFIDFCANSPNAVTAAIRTIYYNTDHNNRTGHLKQGYYGVQRFLQEYPQHMNAVSNIRPDDPILIPGTQIADDWLEFMARFHDEEEESYGYVLATLADTYLTERYGGHRRGGGGGDYPFRLV